MTKPVNASKRMQKLRREYRNLHCAGAHKDARRNWRQMNRIVHHALAERDLVNLVQFHLTNDAVRYDARV
jgi:hypothetical protein